MDIKELVLETVRGLIAELYGELEYEDLSAEDFQQAISDGVVTVDEIVEKFRQSLLESL
jgi:hypothetical protein